MAASNLTVFGYVRVSTENQLENYSIDEQIQRITAYCQAKGWNLIKIYTDGGFSGGNINRPALQQMLEAIHKNKIDAVVVYKLDRLSRSQKDTLTLIEDEFLKNNVDFVSINENFDTSTPFGRAMIGILSVFAQLEKDQITERFMMGRIGRGKAGYFHGGGNSPLGYDYKDGELIINEYQAIQVKEVYELFLAGKSINFISRQMADKYKTKWSASKVRIILSNSLYISKVKFGGKEYPGKHKPIIEEKVFHSANELLHSSEREAKKNTAQKTPFRASTLLSGLVFCGQCGARYSGNHGYYRCYSRSKSSKKYIVDPNCKNDNWPIEMLDNAVISSINKLLDDQVMFQSILKSSEKKDNSANLTAIQKRLKEIDNQTERLIELYQVGGIPMENLTQRISKLKNEQEILSKQLSNDDSATDKKQAFIENLNLFKTSFHDSSLESQRLMVSTIVSKITINGNKVEVNWRI